MNPGETERLNELYIHYHKLMTCYKWKYKRLKKINLSLNILSILLSVSGAGLAPLTHFISLSITGVGVIIQSYVTKSNIAKKIESSRLLIQVIIRYLYNLKHSLEVFNMMRKYFYLIQKYWMI